MFRLPSVRLRPILPCLVAASLAIAGMTPEEIKSFEAAMSKAKSGDPAAQYDVGFAYFAGQGVMKNDVESSRWHLRAAEQGHLMSQVVLTARYDGGIGVEKDPTKAAFWNLKAAMKGWKPAQFSHGMRCLRGEVKGAEEKEAYVWLCLAGTFNEAHLRAAEIEQRMTPEQIAAARVRIRSLMAELAPAKKPASK